jgi:hypothetical protein
MSLETAQRWLTAWEAEPAITASMPEPPPFGMTPRTGSSGSGHTMAHGFCDGWRIAEANSALSDEARRSRARH